MTTDLVRAVTTPELIASILCGEKATTSAFLQILKRACAIGARKVGAEHLTEDIYDRLLSACYSGLLAKIPNGSPLLPYLVTCAARAAIYEKYQVAKEHVTTSIYVDSDEEGEWSTLDLRQDDDDHTEEDVRESTREQAIARILSTAKDSLWASEAPKKRHQYMSGAVDFARRLKDLRKKLDLSQREAAELFGVRLATYIAYEHACVKTPAPVLQKILSIAEQTYCEVVQKRLQFDPSAVDVDRNVRKEHDMATYAELKAQAEALLKQADELKKAEIRDIVEEIRAKIKAYGITAEDIFGSTKGAGGRRSRSKSGPKYRGPNGELWSGGPGRRPQWVLDAIARGEDIENYRIN